MRVVNLSIGGTAYEQTEATLFRLLNDEGINVVTAMGNDFERGNPPEYPAAHAGSIAVGAINETSRRAYFSNTGDHIALSAPGMNILSTLPMKISDARDESDVEYNAWSGTSMAAPHVAAAAALVLTKQSGLDGPQMKKHLQKTASPLLALNGKKFAKTVGAGLLDLDAALS
jgi:subtilisin family serine protease